MDISHHIRLYGQLALSERAFDNRGKYISVSEPLAKFPDMKAMLIEAYSKPSKNYEMIRLIELAYNYVYAERLLGAGRTKQAGDFIASVLHSQEPYKELLSNTINFSLGESLVDQSIETIVDLCVEKGRLFSPISVGDCLVTRYSAKKKAFSSLDDDGVLFVNPYGKDDAGSRGVFNLRYITPGPEFEYKMDNGTVSFNVVAVGTPTIGSLTMENIPVRAADGAARAVKDKLDLSIARLTISRKETISYLGNLFEVNAVIRALGLHLVHIY